MDINLNDFLCDNYNKIKVTQRCYAGRFLTKTIEKNCDLGTLDKILKDSKRPYDYFDMIDFVMGKKDKLEISNGYQTCIIYKNV